MVEDLPPTPIPVAGTKSSSEATPPVQLQNWQLSESLGEGGQAFAYRASQLSTGLSGVVKILKPWVPQQGRANSEKEQRLRFQREVLILKQMAELGCPGIVRILESELDPPPGYQPWYAMPYYSAGPLGRIARDGTIEGWAEGSYRGKIDRVLEIAEQVAETLAFMHEHEAVHRDVHVGNIFFETSGGNPILGDFGLAHYELPRDLLNTGQREEFAPWRWRPLELVAGSQNQREPKADVFLLGGVIYEALSGGEYIPIPEYPPGSFKHEQSEFSLACSTHTPG